MIDAVKLQLANQVIIQHPLFGVLITLACFQCSKFLYEKAGRFPIFYPLLVAALLLVFISQIIHLQDEIVLPE